VNLADLLTDVNARFASSYGAGLTNHLPMCLTALHRLGADDTRLSSFAAHYASVVKLEPATTDARVHSAGVDVFARDIARRGRDAVLRESLTTLLLGVGGGAFHGVIRTAYAILANDDAELGRALAYFADVAQPLAIVARGHAELDDVVAALREAKLAKPSGHSIRERVDVVVADARFQEIVARLGRVSLADISGFAARTYLAADDFASLHMLTGAHAVRVLRPFTVDEPAADRALAIAALACFVVCGSPARVDARGLTVDDDAVLRARAIASSDDHVAKLLVAVLDEERACGDRIYRIVATRACRRNRA
jgi:hypothetical protein